MSAFETALIQQQMEVPTSSQGLFELPCGHLDEAGTLHREVEVAEITGYEEDMLASDQVPANRKMDMLLAGCVKRIGNITDRGQIATILPSLPLGDRVFLIFAVRRVTLGNAFPTREKCPKCQTESVYTVDLSDLTVKQMPEPTKRIYDVVLPSGKTARYRVSTGHDERRAADALKKAKADALSLMMLMRMELINGEPPSIAAIKGLSMRDRNALRGAFVATEGGVDTSVELACPSCGHEWSTDLNTATSGFFFPTGARKS